MSSSSHIRRQIKPKQFLCYARLLLKKRYWSSLFLSSQARTTKQKTGDLGEDLAEKCLRKKKYKILHRNWRDGNYEIDLICRDDDIIVFVEVKTRAINAHIPGYFAVTNKKKKALREAISRYRKSQAKAIPYYRFDIVEIRMTETINESEVNHYQGVKLWS